MVKDLVSIVIPTFDNEEVFGHCLRSILSFTSHAHEVMVVVNGQPYQLQKQKLPNVHWLNPGSNLGWMGGINHAKPQATGEYVMMLNDDTQILDYDNGWLSRMVSVIKDRVVGCGPVSNAITGFQNIGRSIEVPFRRHTTPFVSGCCFLVRRDILDEVGWLDAGLRGGDDIDLSMRLRAKGHELAIVRDVFLFHRYASTGKRVHPGYWDSREHAEDIRIDLIRKHGLKKVLACEAEMAECAVVAS